MLFVIIEEAHGGKAMEMHHIPFSRMCYFAMKERQKANATSKFESKSEQLLISGKALQKLCARVLGEACHDEQELAKRSQSHDDHADNTENVNKFETSIRTLNCILIKRLHIKSSRMREEYEVEDNYENKMSLTNNKSEAESEQQWIYKQICALHWIAAADVESHIFDIENDFARHISKPVLIFTPYENLETIAVNVEYINNLVTSSFTANDLNTLYVNSTANKMSTVINTEANKEATLSESLSAHKHTLTLDVQNSEVKLHVDESKEELTTDTVKSEERLANENTNHSFVGSELVSASKLSKLALERVSCTVTSTDIACVNNLLQMYYKCCARNREQCQRLESKEKEPINVANVDNDITFTGLDHIFSKLHSFTCVLCGRLPVKICTLTCCGALLCEKCVKYYVIEKEKESYEPQHETEYEFPSSLSRKPCSSQAQNIKECISRNSESELLDNKQAQYNANKEVECLVCHELLHNVQVNFHYNQDDELRALVRCLKVMYKPYFVKSALPSLSSSSSSTTKTLFSDNNVFSCNWQTFNDKANVHNLQKCARHESNDYNDNNLHLEYNKGTYFANTQQNFQQVNEQCTLARSSGNNAPIFNVTPKMHHTLH